ncbi:MAG TPA: FAD-dependent oxidoreductase [Thermoplasmata archaeon]|nr:FAD-dependent oxidoreductase [Thermoplasmata archaeon]
MDFDVAIVGGGILGTSLAHWLAARYDGTIAVLEAEGNVARHTSARNTGVVHRPFYLHPQERRVFARASQTSYHLWKKYAADKRLPWHPIGTLKVARRAEEMASLEKNAHWAVENGMEPWEAEVLDSAQVAEIEPNVRCVGALHAKTDTVVDYRQFTEAIRADAEALGATFLTNAPVLAATEDAYRVNLRLGGEKPTVRAELLVNCAGGNAVDLAHALGLGLTYTDLHFRGDYWAVDDRAGRLVSRNVYFVPRQSDLPFLDPHWIVRPDGRREIGPNAAPVPRSTDYEGFFRHLPEWPPKIFESPVGPKFRFALSREFLGLAVREAFSSLSKNEMMRRVQTVIPKLQEQDLVSRGFAGIRSNVVDAKGKMEKEAIELAGPHSFHIINYNSPGATGAPAYTAYLVEQMRRRGMLDHLRAHPKATTWDWEGVAKGMGFGG